MAFPPEPWRTAQDYLDAHGERAEDEVRRLARALRDEGNVDDAVKLFEVYTAIKRLRETSRPRGQRLH